MINILDVKDPIGNALGLNNDFNVGIILLKIVLAVLLGAIIGCERSNKRHAAGLRTFILVMLASTVGAMLDIYLLSLGSSWHLISAALVIGIAIISANTTVFSSKSQIKGLTTSVALWGSSLVGITIGVGFYTITIIAFIALIASLAFFPRFEKYLKNRSNYFEIHLELKNSSFLKDFVTVIRKLGLKVDDIEANPAYINSGLAVYSISLSINSKELKKYKTHKEIIESLSSIDYVYHIEELL